MNNTNETNFHDDLKEFLNKKEIKNQSEGDNVTIIFFNNFIASVELSDEEGVYTVNIEGFPEIIDHLALGFQPIKVKASLTDFYYNQEFIFEREPFIELMKKIRATMEEIISECRNISNSMEHSLLKLNNEKQ